MKDFELKFSGLAVGKHKFEYEAKKTFFDFFQDIGSEVDQIKDGNVHFEVDLDKKENLLVFDIEFKGSVIVDCDICLDQLKLALSGNSRVLGKFGEEDEWQEEDVLVIPSKDHKVDLSNIFYELIHLSLPAKKVHESGNCDPEMLRKLEEYNNVGTEKLDDETDPRWSKLKDLFKDKK